MRLAIIVWTASPARLSVVVRTRTRPWPGLLIDGRTSTISPSSRSSSPGRSGFGQRSSSTPPPITPPAIGSAWTTRLIVSEAVCQPLATRPWKKVDWAEASSVWKGCGSNCRASKCQYCVVAQGAILGIRAGCHAGNGPETKGRPEERPKCREETSHERRHHTVPRWLRDSYPGSRDASRRFSHDRPTPAGDWP